MRLGDSFDDPIILRQLIEMADVALAVRYPLTAGAIYDTADPASIAHQWRYSRSDSRAQSDHEGWARRLVAIRAATIFRDHVVASKVWLALWHEQPKHLPRHRWQSLG